MRSEASDLTDVAAAARYATTPTQGRPHTVTQAVTPTPGTQPIRPNLAALERTLEAGISATPQ